MITYLVGFKIITICWYNLKDRYLLQDQTIEIIWTLVPVFILVIIAYPSLQALYLLDDPIIRDLTIKSTGHQWYWSYEYPDFTEIEFDSYIINLRASKRLYRLCETDNSLVLPINTQIRIITSGADVIHAWTVPSIGVKADAVPGRLNQIIFSLDRRGVFYGQCSEICGANHRFIPIKLEAIPLNYFFNWVINYNNLKIS